MRKIEHPSNTNNILITNIQRFSIRDGPGIRTTVVGNDTVLGIGDFSNQTINFLQNNQGRSVMGLSDVIKNLEGCGLALYESKIAGYLSCKVIGSGI